MKYKVLKTFTTITRTLESGDEVNWADNTIPVRLKDWFLIAQKELIDQCFIEEVKETLKPKFVVWEYVTCEYEDGTKKYLNIHEIRLDSEDKYEYNRYFAEEDLREPTPEELKIYFA